MMNRMAQWPEGRDPEAVARLVAARDSVTSPFYGGQ
jgi:hypothetical protein